MSDFHGFFVWNLSDFCILVMSMKSRFTLFLVLVALQLSAHSFLTQLQTLNSNWKNFMLQAPQHEAKSFATDRAFIQAHLFAVENMLRDADVSALSPELKRARMQHLDVLHAYVLKGEFPQNKWRVGRVPVFIDDAGVHCAVGFLIQQSGNAPLAKRIAANNNYIRVYDIADPEMLVWQKNSGFTVHELALIQPTYNNWYGEPQVRAEVPRCASENFPQVQKYDAFGKVIAQAASPRLVGECTNGVLNGRWEQYYAAGRPLVKGNFANGEKNGTWITYYQNALGPDRIERLENWKDDALHGAFILYYADGSKREAGEYYMNKKHGTWSVWHGGKLFSEFHYDKGIRIGTWYWHDLSEKSPKTKPAYLYIEVYENDILLRSETYAEGGVFRTRKTKVGNCIYYTQQVTPEGKPQLNFMTYESFSIDSEIVYSGSLYGEDQYRKEYKYKIKTYMFGKCVYYPSMANPHITQKTFDSAYLYLMPNCDSMLAAVTFYQANESGAMKDSVWYSKPQAFYTHNPLPPQNCITEIWTWDANHQLKRMRRKDGFTGETYEATYNKGEQQTAISNFPSGKIKERWQVDTTHAGCTVQYERFNENGVLIEQGFFGDLKTKKCGTWQYFSNDGSLVRTETH
jgi:antitoxin component YwqK of YwqJK toxin-antitoxin module